LLQSASLDRGFFICTHDPDALAEQFIRLLVEPQHRTRSFQESLRVENMLPVVIAYSSIISKPSGLLTNCRSTPGPIGKANKAGMFGKNTAAGCDYATSHYQI
jgi:hypothetical protein